MADLRVFGRGELEKIPPIPLRSIQGDSNSTMAGSTKTCPCCGQILFADMDTCFECMYKFAEQEGPDMTNQLPLEERLKEETCQPLVTSEANTSEVCLWIKTPELEAHIPLPKQGLRIGRSPHNDVVLHSRAVSRSHTELLPDENGMVVRDLGATNPILYQGKALEGSALIPFGEMISLCGNYLLAQKMHSKKPKVC